MRRVKIFVANREQRILLGRRGENEATEIVFDVSQLISTYGDGTAQLVAKLSTSTDPYPVSITQDGSTVTWLVTNADTQAAGNGECELFWYVGDVLAKSIVYTTVVLRDIGDVGEDVPAPYETWVEQVMAAGASAQENADFLRNASATAETLPEGSEATASVEDGVFTFGIPTGATGATGADAVMYVIEPSVNTLVYDPNTETYSHDSIVITVYKIEGSTKTVYSQGGTLDIYYTVKPGARIHARIDFYVGQTSATFSIPANLSPTYPISFSFYGADSVKLAATDIPIISNGEKGDTGASFTFTDPNNDGNITITEVVPNG